MTCGDRHLGSKFYVRTVAYFMLHDFAADGVRDPETTYLRLSVHNKPLIKQTLSCISFKIANCGPQHVSCSERTGISVVIFSGDPAASLSLSYESEP